MGLSSTGRSCRWVAFLSGTRLFKVAVANGQPIPLAEISEPYCAIWLADDRIILSDSGGVSFAMVPAGGGTPRRLHGAATYAMSSAPFGVRGVLTYANRELGIHWLSDTIQRVVFSAHGAPNRPAEVPREDRILGTSPQLIGGSHLVFAEAPRCHPLTAARWYAQDQRLKVLL